MTRVKFFNNSMTQPLLFLLVAISLLGWSTHSFAQESGAIRVADTSSPRSTLKSFIDACNEINANIRDNGFLDRKSGENAENLNKILDCIDQSQLPAFAREERAAEVAACLKEILDRVDIPPWDEIPDAIEIEDRGGLEKFPRWRIPGTRITIARVDEGPQKYEYLFSTGTVSRAIDYFQRIKPRPYRTGDPAVSEGFYEWLLSAPGHPLVESIVRKLPNQIRHGRTLGIATWKWFGLLISLPIAIGLMALAFRWQLRMTNRVFGKSVFKYCLTIVFPLMAVLTPLAFRYFAQHYLTVRGIPLYYVSFFANLTAVLSAVVLLFAAANRIAETIISSPRINPYGMNAQLIRIVSRLSALVTSVIVFLVGGQYLGIHLTTLLASAGVGGIAVALGAQDTLKTLFGTLSLMADKPFRVGDRILFEKYDGVVEDIGLRSTRVRLLTGNLVTLPNDQLARSDVENVGRRPHIRRVTDFHIPLVTSCEKVEKAVQMIRTALNNHEGMSPDFPPRVYFNEINPTSFNIRMIYWYSPPNYWDFLAFSEKLNIEICRSLEAEGIQFSLPQRFTPTTIDGIEQAVEVKVALAEKPPHTPANKH